MRKAFISAAILAATFATVPLAAQPGYQQRQGFQDNRGWDSNAFWRGAASGPWERIQFLQQRINGGVRDGSLTRPEQRRAQLQLNRIRQQAQVMRRGGFSRREADTLNDRLDNLSRNIRWSRNNWSDRNRFSTDYDARRYYRDGPQYRERRLSAQDEVYRGSDGRYYCKRSDGTTGLIIGGLAGGVIGNVADGGDNRLAGTLIGGALGALLGREVDRNSDVRCR